jgi:uncharacterized glyoxalase superfamily protein PhnB
MNRKPTAASQTIFPGMRYVDAASAIDWLEKAFGLKRQAVYAAADGTIAHAQLIFNGGMIMLGSYRDDEFRYKHPREVGGVTQAPYSYVADIDAHFARAKAAGAEIVLGLKDTDYGSREYSARDPEGHLWHFGTYLPDMATQPAPAASRRAEGSPRLHP